MSIIRSMYFRSEAEIEKVKKYLEEIRKHDNTPKLPPYVENVLKGYGYPLKEECTPQEQRILYNEGFLSLYQTYMRIQNESERMKIKDQITAALHKGGLI